MFCCIGAIVGEMLNLRTTIRTIIHIPNQPLVTNLAPSSKTNYLASRIFGINQQHKQGKNTQHN